MRRVHDRLIAGGQTGQLGLGRQTVALGRVAGGVRGSQVPQGVQVGAVLRLRPAVEAVCGDRGGTGSRRGATDAAARAAAAMARRLRT
ncbi:hypothetical protein ACF05F_33395 [Rhodococcus erythropolis]